MRLDEVFTLESVPASTTSYDAIPAGMYEATIANAELKDSKSGGKYINVRYDITGPSNAGRVVFGMLNVSNPNPKAEEIGRQQLGELIRAIGLDKLSDTDQLIGGQLTIKLTVENSEKYGEQNRVAGFRQLAKGASKPAASINTPPWQKK
jgi:hypothetical protein